MTQINKPIERSYLRQVFGKEYFILKRKFNWVFGNTKWASSKNAMPFKNSVFKHESMILRPLKDVGLKTAKPKF